MSHRRTSHACRLISSRWQRAHTATCCNVSVRGTGPQAWVPVYQQPPALGKTLAALASQIISRRFHFSSSLRRACPADLPAGLQSTTFPSGPVAPRASPDADGLFCRVEACMAARNFAAIASDASRTTTPTPRQGQHRVETLEVPIHSLLHLSISRRQRSEADSRVTRQANVSSTISRTPRPSGAESRIVGSAPRRAGALLSPVSLEGPAYLCRTRKLGLLTRLSSVYDRDTIVWSCRRLPRNREGPLAPPRCAAVQCVRCNVLPSP